jgi:hypothetical protein
MGQSVQFSALSSAKPGSRVLALAVWLTPWRLGLGFAIALMLACYVVAINAYWVGDDYNYVRPKDWNTVLNFFNPVGRAVYRPLTHSIWAADYALFGDAPLGWHITRLIIHALNIVWAALLVRALTGRTRLALLAAALFGVHPAQTETVTWMGGQADINFAVAWLPALWFFVRWRQGGGRWMWLLAGLLGFVSMLGKEAAITLPLMSLWIDLVFGRDWVRWPGHRARGWWRDRRLYPRLLADHSLFIAASGLYVAMRLYLYFTGQGRLMYGVEEQLGFFSHTVDVITGYIFLALGAWWVPQEVITEPLLAKVAIIVLTAVLLAALVRWLGRVALFAIGWTGITLLLTLQAVANRWFYLPALGVGILIACVFVRLQDDLRGKAVPWERALAALPLLFLVWWSVLTVVHNELWRQSGEVARGIMGQVRALHPDPPRPSTFYLANPPPTYKTVLLFNSGFGTAVYLVYHDWTGIKSYNLAEEIAPVQAALADPSKTGPNPVFLRYEEGRMVEYPSLQALVEADRLR